MFALRRHHHAMKNEECSCGFTLIELLVVIIVIGILASVAVPLFLNQQKTAIDAGTKSDVRNILVNSQSESVRYPESKYFVLIDNSPEAIAMPLPPVSGSLNATDENKDGKIILIVGNSETENTRTEVSVSKGTVFNISNGGILAPLPEGQVRIRGWNPSGKNHTSMATGYLMQTDVGGQTT